MVGNALTRRTHLDILIEQASHMGALMSLDMQNSPFDGVPPGED